MTLFLEMYQYIQNRVQWNHSFTLFMGVIFVFFPILLSMDSNSVSGVVYSVTNSSVIGNLNDKVNPLSDSVSNSSSDYTNSLPDLFSKVEKSVVQITEPGTAQNGQPNPSRLGSGFVYDKLGHIVTNFHVVDGAKNNKAYITFLDGVSYEGDIIGTDPYSDLAVIKLIDVDQNVSSKLVPVELGNSSQLRIGEKVVAVGNPFGLSGSLSEGIISGLGRLMPAGDSGEAPTNPFDSGSPQPPKPSFSIPDIIQTDAAINPGNSGGPLIDMKGKLIGINTAIFSNTGVYSGIGFAIPSNFLAKIVPELIKVGHFEHPYIGVNGFDVTPEIAKMMNLREAVGFLVVNVTEGSPAEKSGILGGNETILLNGTPLRIGGDIITRIDDKSVRKVDDILSYLENYKTIGDKVNLTVLRGEDLEKKEISMVLTSRPSPESSVVYPTLGVLGLDVTPEIASFLNLSRADGFLITSIIENSSAADAKLKGGYTVSDVNGTLLELGGDVIIRLDNVNVKSQQDIKDYLKTKKVGDSIIVTVLRDGAYKTVAVTLKPTDYDTMRLQEFGNPQSGQIQSPRELIEKFLQSCSQILPKEVCESMVIIR
ncbi:MAG: trypsin-like peptidase domain-containing protein [Candidatus Nitrosocosmicus sp.]